MLSQRVSRDSTHAMLRVAVARRLAAVAVASALLGGCGSESPPPEAAENPSTDYDEAAAVVREYVDAISADDVDAAMSLRCRSSRPAGRLMDQFVDELERLEQAIGPIEGASRPDPSQHFLPHPPSLGLKAGPES